MKDSNCSIDSLIEFGKEHGKDWSAFGQASKLSEERIGKLNSLMKVDNMPLVNSDADLVVFGSIARGEATEKSDVDWTLLVNGQVNAVAHNQAAKSIREGLIGLKYITPGPSGLFGDITFSQDLVHHIGGQEDTNFNLSRRILLLLESLPIGDSLAYNSVISAIIEQYFEYDSSYRKSNEGKQIVPRFLLNDFSRFWRTMCVDFAHKQIERGEDKWALRNLKLRMSRRIIFLKGLLMCFECYADRMGKEDAMKNIDRIAKLRPLEFIYCSLSDPRLDIDKSLLVGLFECYDLFLGKLNEETFRKSLQELSIKDAYEDPTFIKSREISEQFQSYLHKILFDKNNELKDFMIKYGIF